MNDTFPNDCSLIVPIIELLLLNLISFKFILPFIFSVRSLSGLSYAKFCKISKFFL